MSAYGKAAFHLGPVYDRLKAALKTSNNLGLDETTVRVLDPGRGKTKTGYLWTMVPPLRGPDLIDGVVLWVYNSKDVFDSVFKRCRVLNCTEWCAAGRDGGYEN